MPPAAAEATQRAGAGKSHAFPSTKMTCAVHFICRVHNRHGDRTKAGREAGPLTACRKLGVAIGWTAEVRESLRPQEGQ